MRIAIQDWHLGMPIMSAMALGQASALYMSGGHPGFDARIKTLKDKLESWEVKNVG